MAALNFPSSPALNELYTDNGKTFKWDGVSWINVSMQSIGYTGSQGLIGYTGSQGDQGLIGYTGSKGDQGITGFTGSQGVQGDQGLLGYTGSQGIQGLIGYTGSQGVQGTTGFTGSQGNQGTTGFTGSAGPVAGSANQIIYRNSSNVVTGSDNFVYDGVSIKVNGNLESTFSNGDEGGEIFLNKPQTNNTLAAGITVDVFQNKLRFFENGGTNRGAYIDLTAATAGVGTNLLGGNTGFTGSVGFVGSKGDTGFTGSVGFVGSTGTTGDTGFTGSIGFTGSKGDIGFTGSKGDIGYTGSKGDPGTFGGAAFDYTFDTDTADTDPGTGYLKFDNTTFSSITQLFINQNDDNSVSVYNYLQSIDDSTSTIKGHFTVTEKANPNNYAMFAITGSHTHATPYFKVPVSWLSGSTTLSDNLDVIITFARTGDRGDTGFTGSQGSQGNIGYTGSQGDQGLIGYTGSQGTTGTTGFTGSQGDQGVIGYTGSQGDQGVIGYTGSKGDQGLIGYTGSQGIQGDQGLIGYTGSQGVQGTTGFTGSQGSQGVIGYTGSQGSQGSIGFTGSASTVVGYTGSTGPTTYPSSGLAVSTGTAWGTSLTAPTGAIVGTTDTQTLSNKRLDFRVTSTTSASSLTPDVSTTDIYVYTALAAGLTINAPIGTPLNGTRLLFRILDNGTARALTWDGTFTPIGVTLPTTTVINKTTYVGCMYNAANTRWDVIAVITQA